jgi:hypothetical protein
MSEDKKEKKGPPSSSPPPPEPRDPMKTTVMGLPFLQVACVLAQFFGEMALYKKRKLLETQIQTDTE